MPLQEILGVAGIDSRENLFSSQGARGAKTL